MHDSALAVHCDFGQTMPWCLLALCVHANTACLQQSCLTVNGLQVLFLLCIRLNHVAQGKEQVAEDL